MTNDTRRGWGVSITPWPHFTRGKKPGTHCTGGWAGPRARLDRCGKFYPPPGFDTWTVQPVASRYTDNATRPIILFYTPRNITLTQKVSHSIRSGIQTITFCISVQDWKSWNVQVLRSSIRVGNYHISRDSAHVFVTLNVQIRAWDRTEGMSEQTRMSFRLNKTNEINDVLVPVTATLSSPVCHDIYW
jgi:hypothetical protein